MDGLEHSPGPFQEGIMSSCPISTEARLLILSGVTLSKVPWLPLAGLASLWRCTRPDGPPQAPDTMRAEPGGLLYQYYTSLSILYEIAISLLQYITKTLSAAENTSTLLSVCHVSTKLASSDPPVLESGAASFPALRALLAPGTLQSTPPPGLLKLPRRLHDFPTGRCCCSRSSHVRPDSATQTAAPQRVWNAAPST